MVTEDLYLQLKFNLNKNNQAQQTVIEPFTVITELRFNFRCIKTC
jgi:hypothetical protein